MSFSSTIHAVDYTGNGGSTSYVFPFKIFSKTDLRVTKRNTITSVETLLVLDTDYSVSGVGLSAGGSITLSTALAVTEYMVIRRVLPLVQNTDIRNQGAFYPEVIEDQMDRELMIAQAHQDEIARSLRMPDTIRPAMFNMKLPASLMGSPGQTIIVNPAGNGWVAGPTADAIYGASTYAAQAFASKTAAAISETNSANSATASAGSATAASTSASGAGTSATAAAASAVQAAASAASILLAAEQTATIANGQATPADLAGCLLSSSTLKFGLIQMLVQRITTGAGATEIIEGFMFMATYGPTGGWKLFPITSADQGIDSGVTFSITSAGQVQYLSNTITGTPSVSKANFRVQSLVG